MGICKAVAFRRWNITNFCVILFLQTWSGHQMTCEGAAVVWQWRGSSKTRFPKDSNLLWILKYFLSPYKRKVWFTQHGISASLLFVSPSIWCDALHDRVWHLSRLVPWKVGVLTALTHCKGKVNPFSSATSSVCCVWIFLCSCVGVEEDKATEIDLYHCPNCQVTHGPSVSKSFSSSPHWVLFMFFITRCLILQASLLLFTVRKRRGGNKQTTDHSAAGVRDPSRPVKTGSPQFVRELRSRTFPK